MNGQLTVRQFIDAVKALAWKGWIERGLRPVFGVYGDGINTACARKAIGQTKDAAEEAIADILGDYGLAQEVISCLPMGFDGPVLGLSEDSVGIIKSLLANDDALLSETPPSHFAHIGFIIGDELSDAVLAAPKEPACRERGLVCQ